MAKSVSTADFIHHPDVVALRQEADEIKQDPSFSVSDIIDNNGFQYVDLVQEGGGVLGIALVGYAYMLERLGIRFFHLAGTSAGAINTIMLAGLGPIQAEKALLLLQVLSEKNLFDLVDGDSSLKKIMQKVIEGTPFRELIWSLLWRIKKIKTAILEDFGLNPGKDFENWISRSLANGPAHLHTMEQLMELRQRKHFPAGLRNKLTGNPVMYDEARLAIITADITTQTKVNFPEMLSLYFKEPKKVAPSTLVRTSMSVPLFFMPYEIDHIPDAGTKEHPAWVEKAVYHGPVPDRVKFVDGGLISNFPIDVFHLPQKSVPAKPSFGVRLSTFRQSYKEITDFREYLGGLIGTMRYDSDNEFLRDNPDFNKLITYIDADQHVNWLNFNLSADDKLKLFTDGAQKALAFIREFRWEEYKHIRAGRT
jgi:NTE family protein